MMNKSIYLIYSHEHNTGYIGKTGNLRRRFSGHCSCHMSCVKQFCKNQNINTRDAFDIYKILQCDKADAAYYEGHIYDLVESCFPRITLITKTNLIEVSKNRISIGVTTTWIVPKHIGETGVITT